MATSLITSHPQVTQEAIAQISQQLSPQQKTQVQKHHCKHKQTFCCCLHVVCLHVVYMLFVYTFIR